MNRIALLILANLTGAGAVYAVWLAFGQTEMSTLALTVRILAAVVILGGTFITWEGVLNTRANHAQRLRRTAAVILILGIVGVGANSVIGMTTKAPDGPIFVIAMLLVLQAFFTIGLAGQDR